MKRLMWYVGCCMMPFYSASSTYASPEIKSSNSKIATGNADSLGRLSSTDDYAPTAANAASLGKLFSTDYYAPAAAPVIANDLLGQVPPPPPTPTDIPTTPVTPSGSETQEIQNQLNDLKTPPAQVNANSFQPKSSPAFSIFNPIGFGADKNLVFLSVSYQNRTRFTQSSDGEAGIGIGLGDAVNSVGAEISYSLNSFGSSAGFGSGAFNAKLHKRIGEDTAVAIGWNQFAKVQFGGGRNANSPSDFPNNSYYLVGTKILRTTDDINQPFSRLALTAGVGSGVFLPFDRNASLDRGGLNVFGSVGVRVARPISAVVEWTGADLAAGVSIAPFDNIPLVITPAVRDITGAGDGARFILGASLAFNF